ncbi:hypothetical protein DID75_01725 [Candidatus Marinamargulisbacteria bacterium SCGC AG-410-N11]|nr:hypothetical protein DID75_01725 [Candidatus Marinamargulisbacteria bacterium SCGC AG-410-N11]
MKKKIIQSNSNRKNNLHEIDFNEMSIFSESELLADPILTDQTAEDNTKETINIDNYNYGIDFNFKHTTNIFQEPILTIHPDLLNKDTPTNIDINSIQKEIPIVDFDHDFKNKIKEIKSPINKSEFQNFSQKTNSIKKNIETTILNILNINISQNEIKIAITKLQDKKHQQLLTFLLTGIRHYYNANIKQSHITLNKAKELLSSIVIHPINVNNTIECLVMYYHYKTAAILGTKNNKDYDNFKVKLRLLKPTNINELITKILTQRLFCFSDKEKSNFKVQFTHTKTTCLISKLNPFDFRTIELVEYLTSIKPTNYSNKLYALKCLKNFKDLPSKLIWASNCKFNNNRCNLLTIKQCISPLYLKILITLHNEIVKLKVLSTKSFKNKNIQKLVTYQLNRYLQLLNKKNTDLSKLKYQISDLKTKLKEQDNSLTSHSHCSSIQKNLNNLIKNLKQSTKITKQPKRLRPKPTTINKNSTFQNPIKPPSRPRKKMKTLPNNTKTSQQNKSIIIRHPKQLHPLLQFKSHSKTQLNRLNSARPNQNNVILLSNRIQLIKDQIALLQSNLKNVY